LGEVVSTFRHVALAACVLAAAVGGCAIIDRADPRHDTINRAAANARNESILLNIVRASHDVPLNFVAFSRVSGSQSAQANVGLPAFSVGPPPLVTAVQKHLVFGSSVFNANTNSSKSRCGESKHLVLPRPLGGHVHEASHSRSAWQLAFDRSLDKVGGEECERDLHMTFRMLHLSRLAMLSTVTAAL
jgi:hypothetical protein